MGDNTKHASGLTVPDNVPADVVGHVQKFLDAASKADSEGGIGHYALMMLDSKQSLFLGGVMTETMKDGIIMMVASIVIAQNKATGGRCNCADCQAERAASAPDRKPSLFERIFGVRK